MSFKKLHTMKASDMGNVSSNLNLNELEKQIKLGNATQVISTIETTLNKIDGTSKKQRIQLLLFRAEANLWLGHFDNCLEDLKESKLLLKQDFDRKLNHKMMILFAECYSYMGYYENSNEYIELGLNKTRFIGDESIKIQFMILKAKYHKYSHRDDLYYETIEDAYDLWFDSNLKPIPILSYYYGKVSIEIDAKSDAKEELTAAYNLYKELSDVRGMANVLIQYDKLNEENKNNKTGTYLEEALNIALTVNDSLGLGEIYHHIGWKFLNKKDPQTAKKYFEKAENIYKKLDARYLMAGAIKDSAFVFHHDSDYTKAIQLFDTAINIYLETNTFFDASDAFYYKGNSLFANKNYEEAFLSFNHSAYYYIENKRGMKLDIAMRSYWCARSKSKLGLYDEALGFYNTAIFTFKEKEMSDMLSDTYYRIANDYESQGNHKKVIEYQSLAKETDVKGKEAINLKRNLRNEVKHYININDFEKALEIYQELLRKNNEIEDKKQLGFDYVYGGTIYSGLRDWDNALKYYSLAHKVYNEVNNKYNALLCLIEIGKIYSLHKNYTKALTYFKKVEEIIDKKKYPNESGELNYNLAYCYNNLKEYEFAIDYYLKVIDFWKNTKKKDERIRLKMLGNSFEDLSFAYIRLKRYTDALEYLKISLTYFEKIESFEDVAFINKVIGTIYYDSDNSNEKAISYLDKARSYYLNSSSDNTTELAEIYEMLGTLYCRKGEINRGKAILQMAIMDFQKLKNKEKETRIQNYLKQLH